MLVREYATNLNRVASFINSYLSGQTKPGKIHLISGLGHVRTSNIFEFPREIHTIPLTWDNHAEQWPSQRKHLPVTARRVTVHPNNGVIRARNPGRTVEMDSRNRPYMSSAAAASSPLLRPQASAMMKDS